jgi:hypothetical protein
MKQFHYCYIYAQLKIELLVKIEEHRSCRNVAFKSNTICAFWTGIATFNWAPALSEDASKYSLYFR